MNLFSPLIIIILIELIIMVCVLLYKSSEFNSFRCYFNLKDCVDISNQQTEQHTPENCINNLHQSNNNYKEIRNKYLLEIVNNLEYLKQNLNELKQNLNELKQSNYNNIYKYNPTIIQDVLIYNNPILNKIEQNITPLNILSKIHNNSNLKKLKF